MIKKFVMLTSISYTFNIDGINYLVIWILPADDKKKYTVVVMKYNPQSDAWETLGNNFSTTLTPTAIRSQQFFLTPMIRQ